MIDIDPVTVLALITVGLGLTVVYCVVLIILQRKLIDQLNLYIIDLYKELNK